MNKIKVLMILSSPVVWIKIGVFLVVFFMLVKSIFFLGEFLIGNSYDNQTHKVKVLKEKLKLISSENDKLMMLEKRLPYFLEQIEYATSYFTGYGLKFEPLSDWEINQQNFKITGDIKAVFLAIHDTKQTPLLLNFGQIIINKNHVEVKLSLFGKRQE